MRYLNRKKLKPVKIAETWKEKCCMVQPILLQFHGKCVSCIKFGMVIIYPIPYEYDVDKDRFVSIMGVNLPTWEPPTRIDWRLHAK